MSKYTPRTFEAELDFDGETALVFRFKLSIPGNPRPRATFEFYKCPKRQDRKEEIEIRNRKGVSLREQKEKEIEAKFIAWQREHEGYSYRAVGPSVDRREDAERQAEIDAVDVCLHWTGKGPVGDIFLPPRRLQTREFFFRLARTMNPKPAPPWQRYVLENWVKGGLWLKPWKEIGASLDGLFPSYAASTDAWKKRLGNRSEFGLTAGGERL